MKCCSSPQPSDEIGLASIQEAKRKNSNAVRFSLQKVMAYDNREVRARLKDKLNLSEKAAQALFDDLKRFLWLCGIEYGGPLRPPPQIDRAWHEFILYTYEYEDFCKVMFAHMVHHRPDSYFGTPIKKRPSIDRTINEAKKVYGSLSKNWKMQ